MIKQQYLSCLINETMIPRPHSPLDMLATNMQHIKERRHARFCDAMALRVKAGGFTDDEKETIADMIDWKFIFLNTKPSEFYDIIHESDNLQEYGKMSKEDFFHELRQYGVDVDELER